MKKGFTLIEILISIMLTAIVFTYIYTALNSVKKSHLNYKESSKEVTEAQKIFSIITKDLTELKESATITHEAGFDRVFFFTKNSIYGISNPWVHYYISAKDNALIRVEATNHIDFFGSNYIGDANGTYFFADKLAEGCSSFRLSKRAERIDILLRCDSISPIVATIYKGDI